MTTEQLIANFAANIDETPETVKSFAGDLFAKHTNSISALAEVLAERAVELGGGDYQEREQYFYDALMSAEI